MCIKCEMKRLAAAMLGAKLVQIDVGTVTPELLAELNQMDDAKERLENELDADLNAVEADVNKALGVSIFTIAALNTELESRKDELLTKYKKKIDELENLQNTVWQDALKSAGIDIEKQAGDYSINGKTGVVVLDKFVKLEKAEVAETAAANEVQ